MGFDRCPGRKALAGSFTESLPASTLLGIGHLAPWIYLTDFTRTYLSARQDGGIKK